MQSSIHSSKTATKRVLLAMDWYTHLIHRGILDYAAENNWSIDASMVHTTELWYADQYIDGILCLSVGSQPIIDLVTNTTVPVAFVGAKVGLNFLPGAGIDLKANGKVAADYFIKQGYQNLAYATSVSRNHPRIRGFVERAAEAGIETAEIEWKKCGTDRSPRHSIAEALATLPKPLGIMAQNDDHALIVLDACEIAGIYVPEEVAVVGGDNDPDVCDFAPIPLTSVDARLRQCGYRGARILDILMQGEQPKPPVEWIKPSGVVVRRSSDIIPIKHLNASKALRYMQDNFANPSLSIDAIADAAGMTKRGLNKALAIHLNRSISKELLRTRLSHARRMLQQSNTPIHRIATICGFTSAKHLRDTIHRELHTSPSELRHSAQQST